MNENKIGIAGYGWGFWAVVNSIAKVFSKIELLNNEEPIAIEKFIRQNPNLNISIVNHLNHFKCDLLICAGFKPIIKKDFLASNKIVNIHYSLLPKYRGLHSTVWAILNDEPFLGYTVHLMNEFIDDGDIIFQYKINNVANKSSTDYMNEFNNHVQNNIGSVIEKYLNGEIIPMAQDKSNASWVGKRSLEDCKIDFNLNYKDIANMFRALVAPYPTPFFEYNSKRYFPTNSKFHPSDVKTHIGRILNIDNEGVWIKVNDGYVVFSNMYSETGEPVSTNSFKIGNKLNHTK